MDKETINVQNRIDLTPSQYRSKSRRLMEDNDIEEVIEGLKAKGYTLTFNPEDSNAASWGVSEPWPSDIDFDVDEVVNCKDADGILVRVLAVTTKPFGLKGIVILSGEAQKYWTIEEIITGFKNVFKTVLRSLFKRH